MNYRIKHHMEFPKYRRHDWHGDGSAAGTRGNSARRRALISVLVAVFAVLLAMSAALSPQGAMAKEGTTDGYELSTSQQGDQGALNKPTTSGAQGSTADTAGTSETENVDEASATKHAGDADADEARADTGNAKTGDADSTATTMPTDEASATGIDPSEQFDTSNKNGRALLPDGATVEVANGAELQQAVQQTNWDNETTVILQPDANGEFDMTSHPVTIQGEHIVLRNAPGKKVTIKRGNGSVNFPLFTVTKGSVATGKLTVDPTSDENLVYSGNSNPFVRQTNGGEVVINGGTFTNNTGSYGTVIQNGYLATPYSVEGADNSAHMKPFWDHAVSGGPLTINGGNFNYNKASDSTKQDGIGGGVIYIANKTVDANKTIITGGDFFYNSANYNEFWYYGGGVIYMAQGYLEVSGGDFYKNSSPKNDGGAIDAMNMSDVVGNSVVKIKNPKDPNAHKTWFEYNKAGRRGGAIAGQGKVTFHIEGGLFEHNTTRTIGAAFDGMGGAIYTDEDTTTQFGHTVAYENTAGHFGGGIWLCPSGHDESTESGNIAVFDNKLDRSVDIGNDEKLNDSTNRGDNQTYAGDLAGDDIAVMYPNKPHLNADGTLKYPSTSIMVNDSWFDQKDAVKYYWDGQTSRTTTGYDAGLNHMTTTDRPRYHDAEPDYVEPGKYEITQDWVGGMALKAITGSASYEQTAKSEADVIFYDNTASKCGGAIATDGTIVFSTGQVAFWNKVDETPHTETGTNGSPYQKWDMLSGSSWKITSSGSATPYANEDAENGFWEGDAQNPNRWTYNSTTGKWEAIVEDNTGQSDYHGYDTDSVAGEFMIENIKPGTYDIVEWTAPSGYRISNKTYSFTAPDDASVLIPGITNAVADSTGKQILLTDAKLPPSTSANFEGKKHLEGGTLKAGQFRFRMSVDPTNDPNYQATVDAVAAGDIIMPNNTEATNDADGYFDFEDIQFLKPGNYTFQIQELDADGNPVKDGYTHDNIAYEAKTHVVHVSIGDGGSYLSHAFTYLVDGVEEEHGGDRGWGAIFTNKVEQKYDFSFTKVDNEDQSKTLSGAEFKLYLQTKGTSHDNELVDPDSPGADFTLVGTATSGDDGAVTFSDLSRGTYRLVETHAPNGYQLPKGQWKFELDPPTGATTSPYHPTMVAVAPGDTPQPPAFVPATNTGGVFPGVTTHGLLATNVKTQLLPSAGGDGGLGRTLLVIGIVLVGVAGAWVLYQHRVSGVWAWEPGGMPFGPGATTAATSGAGAASGAATTARGDASDNPYVRATHDGHGPKAVLASLLGGDSTPKPGAHAKGSRFAHPHFSENLGLGTPPEPTDGPHTGHGGHGK